MSITNEEVRVGVVGSGLMGADHVARLTTTITGAGVSAIIEPDTNRAQAAALLAPSASVFTKIEDAIEADAVDAVIIATPGPFHEHVLEPALEAGLPILCEKPLADDSESARRIVEAEQKIGKQLIQVGFMRRFDPQYQKLRELITSGTAGELLMLRAVHRNTVVPDTYTQSMLITDSVVHELDVIPWLAGAAIESIEVRYGKRNDLSPSDLREPILVLLQLDNGVLADVEMNVSVQFGYQVATEAVFQRGIARIGQPEGLQLWQDARFQIAEHQSFKTRFKQAYDLEVQAWVDALKRGQIAGPSAWDGYMIALACEAGLKALESDGPVAVEAATTPPLYASSAAASA